MFGQKINPIPVKNNQSTIPENNTSKKTELDQKNVFNIDDIHVHTMAEDIENIKNPNNLKKIEPVKEKMEPVLQGTLNQKQQSSPFIDTPNAWNDRSILNEKIDKKNPRNIVLPTAKGINLNGKSFFSLFSGNNDDTEASSDEIERQIFKKKLIASSFLFFLILIFISAGYSIWKSKKSNDITAKTKKEETAPSQTPVTKTPIEPTTPVATPSPALSYSQETPNYFPLGAELNDTDKVKNALQAQLQKIASEGYAKPVEFIITDEKNTPITFKVFASRIGLKLSTKTMDNLGDNFSLFIYNDAMVTRIGLAVESKNDLELIKSLSLEEKNLADEINPLFFTTNYDDTKGIGSSEYAGAKIRYQNIISPTNLSVDYSVYKNKLLIGTTKLTIRSIIDYLNK